MSGSIRDARVSVWKGDMSTCYVGDATRSDFNGGHLWYEMTPSGCAAGELGLGLLYEDVEKRGYWVGPNIVEISTGDDVLLAPIIAGATKVYVKSRKPYDPALGADGQQLFFNDGVHLTLGVPVTGVGTDGGGDFLAIGAPNTLIPGNPATLPAYGAGAIVGRRVYAGIIRMRQRPNDRIPSATISLGPLSSAFDEAVDGYTIGAAANVDVSAAISNFVGLGASQWPHLIFNGSNFTTSTGCVFSGSRTDATIAQMISDGILSLNTGDMFVVRVGHDRTPRWVRYYTSASNTYTYNQTFQQGTITFEPVGVQITDQDYSTYYNRIKVNGTTNPATQQVYSAIVPDLAAVAYVGRFIDAAPVTLSACNSDLACANAARALLNQNSLGKLRGTFHVNLRSDVATPDFTPLGLGVGDAIRGYECVTITGFDGTGTSLNNAPDSEMLVPSLWTLSGLSGGAVGPGGAQGWYGTSGTANGPTWPVAPGRRYTLSAYIDNTAVSAGTTLALITTDVGNITASYVTQTPGAKGRVVSSSFVIPPGAKIARVGFTTNGATTTGNIAFSQPMLSATDHDLPYVANTAASNVYGLVSSAKSVIDFSTLESYQEVSFNPIEPDWKAAMNERANATATALHNNTGTGLALAGYVVSPDALSPTYSTAALTLAIPPFLAQFGVGAAITAIAAHTVTLPPSATTWVFLSSGLTWSTNGQPIPVAGSIMYGYATTNATGVLGFTPLASPGVLRVGVGNINFGNHPAPAFSSSTLAPGFTDNTVHAQVACTVALTNVPTDGSVTGLQFYYQLFGSSGATNLRPVDGVPLAQNSATQAVNFGFEVGAGQSVAVFVAYVGIGGKDYGPVAQIGSPAQIASGFSPASLVVTTPYLANGAAVSAPTITGFGGSGSPSFTAVGSTNGISASVRIKFRVTNQPTDGSFHELAIERRVTGSGAAFERYVELDAQSQGSSAGDYDFTPGDITNGQQIDWQARFRSTQGNPSPAGTIGTSSAATVVISNSQTAAMPSAIKSAGPSLTAASFVGAQRPGVGGSAQDVSVTIASSDYGGGSYAAPPAWAGRVRFVLRDHSTLAVVGQPVDVPFSVGAAGVVTATVVAPSGQQVDIGVQYVDSQEQPSAIAWAPGAPALTFTATLLTGINFVADSSFTLGTALWKVAGGTAVHVGTPSGGLAPGLYTNGAAGTCCFYSQPFTPKPGQTYVFSGAAAFGAGGTMKVGVVNVTDYNASAGAGNATPTSIFGDGADSGGRAIPVNTAGLYVSYPPGGQFGPGGTNGALYLWTCPSTGGPTQVCWAAWSVGGTGTMAIWDPQLRIGTVWTGYIAGLATTSTTDGTGLTQDHIQDSLIYARIPVTNIEPPGGGGTRRIIEAGIADNAVSRLKVVGGQGGTGYQPQNLVFNPRFQNPDPVSGIPAGWETLGTGVSGVASFQSQYNRAVLSASNITTTGLPEIRNLSAVADPSVSAVGLILSGELYIASLTNVLVGPRMYAYDSSKALLGIVRYTNYSAATAGWQNFVIVAPASAFPSGTAYVSCSYIAQGTNATNQVTAYFTQPQIEYSNGTSPSPYSEDYAAQAVAFTHDKATNTVIAAQAKYANGQTVEFLRPAEALAEKTTGKALSLLTGRTADQITYVTGGATVDSLKPAQAGADVTGSNIANDVANLNGVAIGTVIAPTTGYLKTGIKSGSSTVTTAGLAATTTSSGSMQNGFFQIGTLTGSTTSNQTISFTLPSATVSTWTVIARFESNTSEAANTTFADHILLSSSTLSSVVSLTGLFAVNSTPSPAMGSGVWSTVTGTAAGGAACSIVVAYTSTAMGPGIYHVQAYRTSP